MAGKGGGFGAFSFSYPADALSPAVRRLIDKQIYRQIQGLVQIDRYMYMPQGESRVDRLYEQHGKQMLSFRSAAVSVESLNYIHPPPNFVSQVYYFKVVKTNIQLYSFIWIGLGLVVRVGCTKQFGQDWFRFSQLYGLVLYYITGLYGLVQVQLVVWFGTVL